MASASLEVRMFSGDGQAKLANFRKRLGRLQPELKQQLDKKFADAADPVLNDLRDAIRNTPGGKYRTGLRDSIAAATTVTGKGANQTFRVQSSRLGKKAPLPALIDRGFWFHPTFGRFSNNGWHSQVGKPWFFVTILAHEPSFSKAAREAAQEAFEILYAF